MESELWWIGKEIINLCLYVCDLLKGFWKGYRFYISSFLFIIELNRIMRFM